MVENNEDQYPVALDKKTLLCGKYIINDVLGQGGFGITYAAKEYKTGEMFAIKEYMPGNLATRTGGSKVLPQAPKMRADFEKGIKDFIREAETLSRFNKHPEIVHVLSYFKENGTVYIVMEYLEGKNLQRYIEEKDGKLDWKEALELLRPIIDALDAVHGSGIIHRDVKPENILINHTGEAKLIDFGAARFSFGDRSQSLSVVLTPGFAPEEQYRRHGNQGAWTDLYAFAATYYYAITGVVPPDSNDRVENDNLIPPGRLGIPLPPYVEAVLLKALSVRAKDRYRSMQDFASKLEAVMDLEKGGDISSEAETGRKIEKEADTEEGTSSNMEVRLGNCHKDTDSGCKDRPKHGGKASYVPSKAVGAIVLAGLASIIAYLAFTGRRVDTDEKEGQNLAEEHTISTEKAPTDKPKSNTLSATKEYDAETDGNGSEEEEFLQPNHKYQGWAPAKDGQRMYVDDDGGFRTSGIVLDGNGEDIWTFSSDGMATKQSLDKDSVQLEGLPICYYPGMQNTYKEALEDGWSKVLIWDKDDSFCMFYIYTVESDGQYTEEGFRDRSDDSLREAGGIFSTEQYVVTWDYYALQDFQQGARLGVVFLPKLGTNLTREYYIDLSYFLYEDRTCVPSEDIYMAFKLTTQSFIGKEFLPEYEEVFKTLKNIYETEQTKHSYDETDDEVLLEFYDNESTALQEWDDDELLKALEELDDEIKEEIASADIRLS